MDLVVLANQTRGLLVLNLPHHIVPEQATRGVVGVRGHDPVTGERPLQAVRKAISGSVTLMAKDTPGAVSAPLPRSVLQAPEVQAALGRRAIKVQPCAGEPPAESPPVLAEAAPKAAPAKATNPKPEK